MSEKEFKWDAFASRASFREVESLLAYAGRLPSMYNPERSEVFVSSQDSALRVDDIAGLKDALEKIRSDFSLELSRGVGHQSYSRLYLLEVDYNFVANLLSDLDEAPAGYGERLDVIVSS